jgi:hypothetical protein
MLGEWIKVIMQLGKALIWFGIFIIMLSVLWPLLALFFAH